MDNQKFNKKAFWLGTAAVAGLLGTLRTLFWSQNNNRRTERWRNEQSRYTQRALNWMKSKTERSNKNLFLGGIAGSLMGAATALLLAPKAGKELIQDLAQPLTGTRRSSHAPRKQTIRHQAAAKRIQRKTPSRSSHHTSTKTKRSPSRRSR